jgi:hypothetical protein
MEKSRGQRSHATVSLMSNNKGPILGKICVYSAWLGVDIAFHPSHRTGAYPPKNSRCTKRGKGDVLIT